MASTVAADRLNAAWRGLVDGIAPSDWTAERRREKGWPRLPRLDGADVDDHSDQETAKAA